MLSKAEFDAQIKHVAQQTSGLFLIQGERGSGKTSVVSSIVHQWKRDGHAPIVFSPFRQRIGGERPWQRMYPPGSLWETARGLDRVALDECSRNEVSTYLSTYWRPDQVVVVTAPHALPELFGLVRPSAIIRVDRLHDQYDVTWGTVWEVILRDRVGLAV